MGRRLCPANPLQAEGRPPDVQRHTVSPRQPDRRRCALSQQLGLTLQVGAAPRIPKEPGKRRSALRKFQFRGKGSARQVQNANPARARELGGLCRGKSPQGMETTGLPQRAHLVPGHHSHRNGRRRDSARNPRRAQQSKTCHRAFSPRTVHERYAVRENPIHQLK